MMNDIETLTDKLHVYLSELATKNNDELNKNIELKELIDDIYELLADERITSNIMLKKNILKRLNDNLKGKDSELYETSTELKKIVELSNLIENDRIAAQNSQKSDYIKIDLRGDGERKIKPGTSNIKTAIKRIKFLEKNVDINQYKSIYILKKNEISENDKGLIVGIVNQKALDKIKKKYQIKKFTFALARWMQYIQNLYTNYRFNHKNEEFISKLIKIYDQENYYKIDAISGTNNNEADITVVEMVQNAIPIYSDKKDAIEKGEWCTFFKNSIDVSLNDFNEKSLFKAFQIAFMFGIADRINSGNLLKKSKTIFNIDFGQLFDFQHNITLKRFCEKLEIGEIKEAKRIFLDVWKKEFNRKLFMRRTAQIRPIFGLFFESNRRKLDDLSIEIKQFKQIYSTLKNYVDNISDNEFKDSFRYFIDKDKLDESIKLWNKFYEDSGKHQKNSSGKNIRYNAAQGLCELHKAFDHNVENNEKEIKGQVKYYNERHYLRKMIINITMCIPAMIVIKKVFYDKRNIIKNFYGESQDNKMIMKFLLVAICLTAVISLIATIYYGMKEHQHVSNIFENGYIQEAKVKKLNAN